MTDPTLNISLRNNTNSSTLCVTITGRAIDRGGAPVLIRADGKTAYYPANPANILSPLAEDCTIRMGQPGTSRTVTIPRVAGGRVWYCVDGPLTFLLNPGPAVVEPSMMNPSDPNHDLSWGFAEFTYNDFQLFVNVSYVDFVGVPASLAIDTKKLPSGGGGERLTVQSMGQDGLGRVCNALLEQDARDGGAAGWGQLVVRRKDNGFLRALSPNSGRVISGGRLFSGYYAAYVAAVYEKYRHEDLVINTQASWGNVRGRVGNDGKLKFDDGSREGAAATGGEYKRNNHSNNKGNGIGSFGPPSAADIFSCDSGPFARGAGWTEARGAVGARLAAAFNRSTLRFSAEHPNGVPAANYYREPVTNHYARICHEQSPGGRGYAFPYDDVGGDGAPDQSGSLWHSEPSLLTVGIGGGRI